jgi:hypothetical protein
MNYSYSIEEIQFANGNGHRTRILKNINYENLKLITGLLFCTFLGCSEDNLDVDLGTLDAPQNISALTTVTQDNTGRLLLPRGEGVTQYEILWRRNFCLSASQEGS